jgi:hypothetical protein
MPPSPTPTITAVSVTFPDVFGGKVWIRVDGWVETGMPPFYVIFGEPLTFTITNKTSGQPVGSFSMVSNVNSPCFVTSTKASGVETLTGESLGSVPACPLGAVTLPEGQGALIQASFAGNSTYAASVSMSATF